MQGFSKLLTLRLQPPEMHASVLPSPPVPYRHVTPKVVVLRGSFPHCISVPPFLGVGTSEMQPVISSDVTVMCSPVPLWGVGNQASNGST